MRSFSPWIDVPLALLCYAAVVGGMLYWVHRSDQTSVKRTAETTRRIWTRLALVAASLVLVCYLVDVAFWLVFAVAMLLVLAAFSGELLGIAGLPLIALAYLIKLYVLGFPELILDPPEQSAETSSVEQPLVGLVGRTTVALSPLRPQGEIQIDGHRIPAKSECGKMIPLGMPIVITGVKNGTLLVRESHDGR